MNDHENSQSVNGNVVQGLPPDPELISRFRVKRNVMWFAAFVPAVAKIAVKGVKKMYPESDPMRENLETVIVVATAGIIAYAILVAWRCPACGGWPGFYPTRCKSCGVVLIDEK